MILKRKILAICGSTKQKSVNLRLIQAISELSSEIFDISIFAGIDTLPHFNPDLDGEVAPAEIISFRHQLKQAEGVLICTPEYAMGVPGSLKNALDWTVSSCDFSGKPTGLITASSQGFKGHESLLNTLDVIEAGITTQTQLLISFAGAKINSENKITDPATLEQVKQVLTSLKELIEKNNELETSYP